MNVDKKFNSVLFVIATQVVKESNTGSTAKTRIQMHLKIKVERVEFDAEKCALRVSGKNVEENEFVKMGQYHTLELEIDRPFKIEKTCWDSIFLERLEEAADPGKKADLAVVSYGSSFRKARHLLM